MSLSKDQSGSSSLEQACVLSANILIEECKLSVSSISSIRDINSSLIVDLFERITDLSVPDLLSTSDSFANVHNVQAVIDTLSLDLLGISLSHISGDNVVSGDPVAILNLLEILETVHSHLRKRTKSSISTAAVSSPKRKITSDSLDSDEPGTEFCPPTKILKRKTCRKTLRKPRQEVSTEENDVQLLTLENVKKHNHICKESQHKKNVSEEEPDVPKTNITTDIKQLHDEIFEKKIRTLLLGEHSPQIRSQQLKQSYLHSLKSPLKRKTISSCKKSFLLPQNLRRRQPKLNPSKTKKTPNVISLKPKEISNEKKPPVAICKFLEEFPGFEFQKNSLNLLTRQYYQHLQYVHGQLRKSLSKIPKTVLQAKEAAERQSKLSNILAKDQKDKIQFRKVKEEQAFERRIKCSLRDARLRSAKIKQYFKEFHCKMQKQLKQRNTVEELVVEKTFKKMLDIQKEKMQLICKQVKEADELDAVRHRQYLETLQQIYEQQMSVLTEIIEEEQKEAADNIKENTMLSRKMTREWRDTLQSDVRSLQKDLLDIIRDTHFREMDAQNFINYQQHKT